MVSHAVTIVLHTWWCQLLDIMLKGNILPNLQLNKIF